MSSILRQFPPKEIIYHHSVIDLPVTRRILAAFPENERTRHIRNNGKNTAKEVTALSPILCELKRRQNEQKDGLSIARHVMEARNIWYLSPSIKVTNAFSIHDNRIKCCSFQQLGPISNGCAFRCQWCYLYGTYRAAQPFVRVCVDVDKWLPIVEKTVDELSSTGPVNFNMADLLDSFFLEEQTMLAQKLIPMFAKKPRASLLLLSKDINTDWLEPLRNEHNNRTILSWSINAPIVSAHYEKMAPAVERRLQAAAQCQQWGFRVRLRLDPIIPVEGWQDIYRETIRLIFDHVRPERITFGTIRFERGTMPVCLNHLPQMPIFQNTDLKQVVDNAGGLIPMFATERQGDKKVQGKYAFSSQKRIELFSFAKREIEAECRRLNIPEPEMGLCKESIDVIRDSGFNPARIACNCIDRLFDPEHNRAA